MSNTLNQNQDPGGPPSGQPADTAEQWTTPYGPHGGADDEALLKGEKAQLLTEDRLLSGETTSRSAESQEREKQRLANGKAEPAAEDQPENGDRHDMRKTNIRWCMLCMACCFLLGSYFCYDNPGPLETQLEQQLHIDSTQYSMLYTVYSLPNMVLPILGGVFLDRIGIRSGLLFFTLVLTLGQMVFMLGGYQANFNLMLAGRVIFGMGGECMGVAQSSIVSVWFKGKELAFALGLNMSMARLGSVANAAIVPSVYDDQGLGMALTVGFCICLFSLANAVGLTWLDKKAEKANPNAEAVEVAEDEKFKWSDIWSFNTSFWLLTGSCVITYMTIFPYLQIASDLLQTKYHFSKITAGYLFGVPYIISAITSPFLGLMIDKLGKRALLICLSSVLLIIAFTSSMFMPECDQCYNEVYPLVLTGIGYSIYAAAIWGSVPYVVPPSAVGTAFGVATAIQNIGLVVAPTLVGLIKDSTRTVDHGYFWVNAFFIAVNIIGLFLNMTLYHIDITRNGGVLDSVDKGSQAPAESEYMQDGAEGSHTDSALSAASEKHK